METYQIHCISCGKDSPIAPQICPHCGGPAALQKSRRGLSPIVVVLLLFLVLGPFALGMLWRNERFSRAWKWVLTILTLIYTVAGAWLAYSLFNQVMTQVESVMNQMPAI